MVALVAFLAIFFGFLCKKTRLRRRAARTLREVAATSILTLLGGVQKGCTTGANRLHY